MFGLGGTEVLVIFVLALLLFGPKKLPEIGRTVGKTLAEFRRATLDFRVNLERDVELDKLKSETLDPLRDLVNLDDTKPPAPKPRLEGGGRSVPVSGGPHASPPAGVSDAPPDETITPPPEDAPRSDPS